MNSRKWEDLNENFAKEYGSYRSARGKNEIVRNAEKVFLLVSDALEIAKTLYNAKESRRLQPEYIYEANGANMPFGLAPALLAELPGPENFSPEGSADFYYKLVNLLTANRLPAEIFLQAFNYANELLPRFQQTHYFTDLDSYEQLEKKLRKRLITRECADLVESGDTEQHVFVSAYRHSLRRVADTFLRQRDYAGAVGFLVRELSVKYPEIPGVTNEIRYEAIYWAHYYNQLLGVLPPLELFNDADDIKGKLTEYQIKAISEFECPSIDGVEVKDMSLRPVDGYISPNSSTKIVLTYPSELPEGEYQVGDWTVRVSSLTDPFSDPNFFFLNRQAFVMGGMPLAVISPVLQQREGVMLLELSSVQPFHPDLDVNEDGSMGDDPREELRQLYGENYDPYIAKAIELLRSIKGEGWQDREALLSGLKSVDSYSVGFLSPDGITTHHMFRPLVKLSSFLMAQKRFLDRFKRATGEGHKSESLKKLLFNDSPMDAEGLLRYAKAVFRELIVRESDRGEWWKTVWVDGEDFKIVRDEPDVGRDIYNVVSHWFRVKGLTFHREVRASGGSIDMLATSASGSQLHRCGIELKFAHNGNILGGISKQLPDYMEDLQAEVGIFLTLWCKSLSFPKPTKYSEISELVFDLRNSVPENMKIDVIAVNASYRPPPSKRR